MKKSVSILLAVAMLMAMSIPAFAMSEKGETRPTRYLEIGDIWTSIEVDGDTATCTAEVSHSGARANISLVLQRSTNGGSTYSDYSTLSNKTYSDRFVNVEESKSGLNTSYDYRTKVVVTVYNSSGRQIDTGTAYS